MGPLDGEREVLVAAGYTQKHFRILFTLYPKNILAGFDRFPVNLGNDISLLQPRGTGWGTGQHIGYIQLVPGKPECYSNADEFLIHAVFEFRQFFSGVIIAVRIIQGVNHSPDRVLEK
ncbi:hypothetical protein D3C76_1312390 [compost metagenome]